MPPSSKYLTVSSVSPRRRASYVVGVVLFAATLLVATSSMSFAAITGPSYVQGASGVIRTGTVNSVPLASGTAKGNLLAVYVVWDNVAPVTVTDSAGNTFAVAAPRRTWSGSWSGQMFYARNIKGGADTVKAAFATSITKFGLVYVSEYSGLDQTSPLDGTAGKSGTSSAMTSGSFTTKNASDVLIGAGSSNNVVTTSGTGFATRSWAYGNLLEDQPLTAAGSYAATAAQNGGAWIMQAVAFKSAIAPVSAQASSTTASSTTAPSTSTTMASTSTTMQMGSTTTATTMPMGSTTTTMPMGSGSGGGGGMSMGADQCALPQLAFCDTFQTKVGGGREGDLDPAKWSFSRISQNNNPSQGLIDNYAPSMAQFCMSSKMVQPDGDSFICGQEFGESNHWMESMDDNGVYATNSNRIRQPFDFAGRTGNMVFDVDAKTEGSHSFWNEVWLTDQPTQAPHLNHPGLQNFPQNGIAFVFDQCGPLPDYQTQNGLGSIVVFNNYQETDYPFADAPTNVGPCFTTQQDHANHFQIKVSSNHIEVWASDAGGTNFRLLHTLDLATPLNFTRGYWSFQHVQYNAAKFNSTNTMTYHWHAIGFDGPALPADGGYEIPDALQTRSDGTLNLGYQIPTKTFSLPNVSMAGVTSAYITYNVWWFATAPTMTVTINGQAITATGRQDGTNGYLWTGVTMPVPLSLLHAGTNTVSFQGACSDQCPTIANFDLETVH